MPTSEEVDAVMKSIRSIEDEKEVPRRVLSLVSLDTISTRDCDTSSKEHLFMDFLSRPVQDEEDDASAMGLAASDTFDVEVLEEHSVSSETPSPSPMQRKGENEGPEHWPKAQTQHPRDGVRKVSLREKLQTITFLRPNQIRKQESDTNVDESNSVQPEQTDRKKPDRHNSFVNFFRSKQSRKQEYDELPTPINVDVPNSVQPELTDKKKPERQNSFVNFFRPNHVQEQDYDRVPTSIKVDESNSVKPDQANRKKPERQNSIAQEIIDDFRPGKGDQKILRAIGRTATVNVAILVTAATGGAAGAIGYVAGGAFTSKRLFDGLQAQDEKEVTKSLAVYGAATGASVGAQALTGVLMVGLAGASLPLAAAVAFGVGCASGISAGALSEWTVDKCMADEEDCDIKTSQSGKSDDDTVASTRTDDAVAYTSGQSV